MTDEEIIRAAVVAMPHTNPLVAEDLLTGFTMHTEKDDIVAIWLEAARQEREGLPSQQELLTLAEALSLYANGDKYQRAVELAEAVIRALAAIRSRSSEG